jgi:hypothetical protein
VPAHAENGTRTKVGAPQYINAEELGFGAEQCLPVTPENTTYSRGNGGSKRVLSSPIALTLPLHQTSHHIRIYFYRLPASRSAPIRTTSRTYVHSSPTHRRSTHARVQAPLGGARCCPLTKVANFIADCLISSAYISLLSRLSRRATAVSLVCPGDIGVLPVRIRGERERLHYFLITVSMYTKLSQKQKHFTLYSVLFIHHPLRKLATSIYHLLFIVRKLHVLGLLGAILIFLIIIIS